MLCFVCVPSDMTSEDQTDRIQQLEKRIEELENKQQLSKFSRRGLLGGIAGVAGLGAMSGSGAAASGQVGTANNRVNVFADEVDANNVTGATQGCRVYLSSDQNISAGTRTKVQFDAKVYDSDNNFDTNSHAWTCPQDGIYLVNFHAAFSGGGNDQRLAVIGSGSTISPPDKGGFKQESNTSIGDEVQVSTVNKYLNGDTIAAYVENDTSSDVLKSGNAGFSTFLEVAFLGGL